MHEAMMFAKFVTQQLYTLPCIIHFFTDCWIKV